MMPQCVDQMFGQAACSMARKRIQVIPQQRVHAAIANLIDVIIHSYSCITDSLYIVIRVVMPNMNFCQLYSNHDRFMA